MKNKVHIIFLFVLIFVLSSCFAFSEDIFEVEDDNLDNMEITIVFNQDIGSIDLSKFNLELPPDGDFDLSVDGKEITIELLSIAEDADIILNINQSGVKNIDGIAMNQDFQESYFVDLFDSDNLEENIETQTFEVDSEETIEEVAEEEAIEEVVEEETIEEVEEEEAIEEVEEEEAIEEVAEEEAIEEVEEEEAIEEVEEEETIEEVAEEETIEEVAEEETIEEVAEEETIEEVEEEEAREEVEEEEAREEVEEEEAREEVEEEEAREEVVEEEAREEVVEEEAREEVVEEEAREEIVGEIVGEEAIVLLGSPGVLVSSTSPVMNEKFVSVDSNIVINFSREVVESENINNIIISDETKSYEYTYVISGSSLNIDIIDSMTRSVNITVQIPSNTVKDNSEMGNNSYDFAFEVEPIYLEVTSTNPDNGEQGIDVNKEVIINFDRDIQFGDEIENIRLQVSGGTVTYDCEKVVSGSSLTIKHDDLFDYYSNILVTIPVNSVKDINDISLMENYSLSFETVDDIYGPKIISSSPLNNSEENLIESNIEVKYDESIYEGSKFNDIKLYKGDVEVVSQISIEGDRLIVNPIEDLNYYSSYRLDIPSSSLEDIKGNGIIDNNSISFKTIMDTLRLIKSYPDNNNEFFNPKEDIVFEFNGDLTYENLGNIEFYKLIDGDDPVAISKSVIVTGSNIIIEHDDLEYLTNYSIKVPKECIKSEGVKDMDEDLLLNFKTERAPDANPLLLIGQNVKNNEFDVNIDTNISLDFDKSIYATEKLPTINLKNNDGIIDIVTTFVGNRMILSANLEHNSKYVLNIPKDSIKDNNGNNISEDIDIVFYTIRDISKDIEEEYYYGDNAELNQDDQSNGPFDISFDFKYFGQNFDSAYISTNGLLSFESAYRDFSNRSLTSSGINNFVTPFWDDLVTENFNFMSHVDREALNNDPWYIDLMNRFSEATSSEEREALEREYYDGLVSYGYVSGLPAKSIYYETLGTEPNRKFVVQWTNMYYYSNPDLQMGTFQTILYEGSNEIQLQYRTLMDADGSGLSYGRSATIGLSAPNIINSIQYSYNESEAIEEKQAIRFYPVSSDGNITYLYNDNSEYDPVYLLDRDMPGVPQVEDIYLPNDGSRVPVPFILRWEDVENTSNYRVVIANDSSFSSDSIVFDENRIEGLSVKVDGIDPGNKYYLRLFAQNSYGSNVSESMRFVTVDNSDKDKPSLVSISPSGLMEVNESIYLTFDEEIIESVEFNNVRFILDDIDVQSNIFIEGEKVVVNPIKSLEYGKTYSLVIPSGSVSDIYGNIYDESIEKLFTTKSKYVRPPKKDRDDDIGNSKPDEDNSKPKEKTYFGEDKINTDDDKKIDQAVLDKGVAEVEMKTQDNEIVLSDEILKSVFSQGDTLKVKKGTFSFQLKDNTFDVTDTTENMDSKIQIKTIIENEKQRFDTDRLYDKGLFRLGNDNFNLEICEQCEDDNKNDGNDIREFNSLLEISVDISEYNLKQSQINKITGIRFDKNPETGEIVPVKLGGTLDMDSATFKFKTDKPGEFVIGTSRELFMVEMELDSNKGKVNGSDSETYIEPKLINNELMVPIRFVGEALGANVKWDEENWKVIIEGKDIDVQFDVREELDGYSNRAILYQSRTLVPLKMIEKEFGVSVVMTEGNSILIVK